MSRFKDAFFNRHVVLAVIHVEDAAQASANTRIARDTGCDGVFLINHHISHQTLLKIHHELHKQFDDWWVGVNCLDLPPDQVFSAVSKEVAGIWVDNAHINERTHHQPEAERTDLARKESGWNGLYFGGVAFKYQRHVADLGAAAKVAQRYMDVVTTSGPGTGQAASRDKIVALREALGDSPLAIASGITPENVGDYLDVADCFLVATGISVSFTQIDPSRARALVQRVRDHRSS
jgi:uncharacterized protein